MKKIFYFFTLVSFLQVSAQVYPSQNISLVGHISPNTASTGIATGGQRYSGCWGWFQASKNKEYAISAGSSGTYFIDISSPATPTVCDYVPGRPSCIWREIKTYQNICYVVSDDQAPNRFQIIDMQYLPDSVHVLHDGFSYFQQSHTIWIDNDKLYCGSVTFNTPPYFSPMSVYSLATPTAPLLLRRLNQDYPSIQHVHDMYVRNDTIYANCGNQGMYLYVLTASNTFSQVGSYTNYAAGSNYNHSSMLTQNGKRVLFCDEVPSGLPIRIVDVQNFSNIVPTSSFIPYATTTPHNPYLIGNDIAVISCYQDGLMVYNISNPATPTLTGFFDTHPQGGASAGTYSNSPYRGNWGAYPYLPSGLIVANDMQNGVFILDPSASYTATTPVNLPASTLGLKTYQPSSIFAVYPNPASDKLNVSYSSDGEGKIELSNIVGEIIYAKTFNGKMNETLNTSQLANGTYLIRVTEKENVVVKKLIVQH